MIRISSEKELLESFRPIDRDHVRLPADVKFPLAIKNSLSWSDPAGHRVYLVFEDLHEGHPLGIAFRRTPGESAPAMCDWCHSVRGRGEVSMLTAAVSKDRQVGVYLCSDLKCEEEIMSAPQKNDLRESLSKADRIQRLLARMRDFAQGNLF